MEDTMSGESYRAIVSRLQSENSEIINAYKNAVALLAISAVINVLLLAGWIYEVYTSK